MIDLKMLFKGFFYKADEETKLKLKRTLTANEFINVRDIKNDIVYTKDSYLFAYLKIQPISLELLSTREQERKAKKFSAEFSAERKDYKLFSISRPVDVSHMLNMFNKMRLDTVDINRRKLISNEIREINEFALSGEIVERQFYMIIWEENKKDAEKEIWKRANEVMSRFKACEIDISICKKGDIVKLFNLFANPNYAHLEDEDIEERFPYIKNMPD